MSERVNFEEEKVLIIGGAKLTADPKRCLVWPRDGNSEIDASSFFWQMENLLPPVDY